MALDALNGEGNFAPNAVTAGRLIHLPDGSRAIRTFKPYWADLRNGFHMFKQAQLLRPLDLAEHFKLETDSRLSKAMTRFVPADDAYRKAQDVFVRTLRNLIEEWRESDWNLAVCFKKHPDMERQVVGLLRREPLVLLASSSGASLLINPFDPFGLFGLQRIPRGRDKPTVRARRDAITLFIRFVQHPAHARVGKCVRCGRYFYGRPGQKCCPRPRRCGSYLAAIEATKRRWNRERKEKLQRAQDACAEWARRRPKADWRSWAAARIGVTGKWLTRAVNRKELKPPRADEGRKT